MPPPSAVPDPPPAARIAYQPGLDGLRAVALLAIFVVHADLGLASGGFLAVSTFFTLSGFLITSLLVMEHAGTGRIALGTFWGRRARRLLPAALVSIAGIAVATLGFGTAGQIARLHGDALAALAYVANWRFVLLGDRYGAGFEGEPTLLHFWSLAIEEQFYVAFPLLCLAAFAWGRRWRPAPAVVFLGGVILSIVTGVLGSLRPGPVADRLYFGTDVRAGELLVGALVGLWWVRRPGRRLPGARWIGPVALVVMLGLIATASHHDLVWYRGGLVGYALVTSAVVLAAIEPDGAVRRLLSWRPLVAIGIVSYGGYLAHWPIFLWLRTGTSLPGPVRLVAGTVLSIAVAAVSYRLIEAPIRHGRRLGRRALAGLATAVVAFVGVVTGVVAPSVLAARGEMALADAGAAFQESLAKTQAAPGAAPTVAVFGDSTALVTGVALAVWDDSHDAVRTVRGWANLGCSIASPALVRNKGVESPTPPVCDDWLAQWTAAVARARPDVAFVQFGPWEVYELKPRGAADFQVVGAPELDAVMRKNLRAGIDALLAHAGVVAIATSPRIERGRLNGRSPAEPMPESDPARMDRLNALIRDVARGYDRVAVIDLAGWVAAHPDDRRLRPDGVHFTAETALELGEHLAPTLAAVAPGADPALADRPGLLPLLQRPRR